MRRPISTALVILAALPAIGCLGGCGGSSTEWLTAEGTSEVMGQYRFVLPAGFQQGPVPNVPVGTSVRSWVGPGKGDFPPSLILMYWPHEFDVETEEPDWSLGLQAIEQELRSAAKTFTAMSMERQRVNGLEGAFRRFTGTMEDGRELRATVYILADKENLIVAAAMYAGNGADDVIGKLEEAVLTLELPGYEAPLRVASIRERPDARASLSESRRGFQTSLRPSSFEATPLEPPPADLFQTVRYKSPVGTLPAYLTLDPGDGDKHPAIIWITGGDCNSIGDVWSSAPEGNDQTARAFREAGIVMMFPSMRGGNENPGKREGFFGEVDDVLAAADFLAAQSYVDPDRIYLGGHSTGGTLVLLVAACSNRFRAVFSFGPVENAGCYGKEFLPFDFTLREEVELRSPVLWLHCIQSPTFVIEGTGGNWDSFGRMQKASQNRNVRFLSIIGKDHFNVLAPATRVIAAKILLDEEAACNLAFDPSELSRPVLASSPPLAHPVLPTDAWPSERDIPPMLRERVEGASRPPPTAAIRDDSSHPDYFKENLAALRSGEMVDRDRALGRLAQARPEDVADPELRSEIARAMRDLAFEGDRSVPDRRKAVRGLATWGSTFSVPLLIKLLDDDSPFVRREAVAVLGELGDDRALEPLAQRFVSEHELRSEIGKTLRQFDSRAEDAVLKYARMDDPLAARQVVQLLGDIGTLKSVRYFAKFRTDKQVTFFLGAEMEKARTAIQQRVDANRRQPR